MMKKLLEIKDIDLGLETKTVDKYLKREAARAIIFDAEGKIAFLEVRRDHYHKLPGGGIDDGENPKEAVVREALEEVGASIKLRDIKVGSILEHRSHHKLQQTSYCFIADLCGELGALQREESEIETQQFPIWVTLDEAIKLSETDNPDDYEGKFIKIRDLTFLKEVKKLIK